MYAYLWYYSLGNNTKGCGGKNHQTDSQNSDTSAPSGRELYHLQFSLHASPETFGYTLVTIVSYGPNDRGSIPDRWGFFSFRHCVKTASGAHPASFHMGAGALSLGVKRPGREAHHSCPSNTDVKNTWSHTFTFPFVFMMWFSTVYIFVVWYLVKHRDNFTFTLWMSCVLLR
jgi:hypothetical protein